ncbi:hypothetical protein ACXU40_09350 [Bordetella bronchiseptica]
MPYDPMNQVHPGPQEGIDRIPADTTQARTGNTEREQETWFAGVEEGQRRAEHNAAVRSAWMPIESAPKDGTEILAWRHDCGQFIASYTSADAFPMTQDELDAMDEETLFAKDWFTQWPDATRLDGSEAPTHWQPLPAAPGVSTVEQAQVVAWMDPDTQDVISAERKASWLNEYGAGGATKAATYTRALGDLRPAPAADDTPPRFTISASDRFELTGAVGLLRGCGYVGPADALQRVLDAESASFSVQGEDDARDAGRLDWLEQHNGRFFNKDRISSIVGTGFLVAGDEQGVRHQTVRAAIDAAMAALAAQQGKGGEA